ncbi:hypothetical protein CH63R_07017 [Colletotrichum higginsianum IMI 349063]|uniref:Uncharacterized protein n=2 Tax=Colletotrichum higginsianum TaxID=80884 RepID=A0A1B7Y8A4_COLHI|nr:hypothetical protein CH63R_07017 [Colletotrichum higginsianum IMI 349063]OBR08252.1 hypothetical protein CH63R_07017 [Colletotrichum higginsianum IMI 349063]TIC89507.1 hypothetical protein CH35J_012776 [Colletotrichum higginsianum]GJC97671.1 hypothetical protein ColKHC_06497 [Colletotrichum higginsianum]
MCERRPLRQFETPEMLDSVEQASEGAVAQEDHGKEAFVVLLGFNGKNKSADRPFSGMKGTVELPFWHAPRSQESGPVQHSPSQLQQSSY